MRLAVVFFGFLRGESNVLGSSSAIEKVLLDYTGEENDVHYFYSCPTLDGEFDAFQMDRDRIAGLMTTEFGDAMRLAWREYDASFFVKESIKLGLPVINRDNYYPYRILSQIYSIQKSAELVCMQDFDLVFFTRMDMVKNIKSIGRCNGFLGNNAFLYRESPYVARDHAEDRVFWGAPKVMECLKNYYDCMVSGDGVVSLPEYMLLRYFCLQPGVEIKPQFGADISTDVYVAKYSKEVYEKVLELYKPFFVAHGLSGNC